jgi:5-methylcytosine-specific restriction endonuclease McrA
VLATESTCWICGQSDFVRVGRHPRSPSVDHVTALAVGGHLTDPANLRLAHYGCNSSRGVGLGSLPARSEAW